MYLLKSPPPHGHTGTPFHRWGLLVCCSGMYPYQYVTVIWDYTVHFRCGAFLGASSTRLKTVIDNEEMCESKLKYTEHLP